MHDIVYDVWSERSEWLIAGKEQPGRHLDLAEASHTPNGRHTDREPAGHCGIFSGTGKPQRVYIGHVLLQMVASKLTGLQPVHFAPLPANCGYLHQTLAKLCTGSSTGQLQIDDCLCHRVRALCIKYVTTEEDIIRTASQSTCRWADAVKISTGFQAVGRETDSNPEVFIGSSGWRMHLSSAARAVAQITPAADLPGPDQLGPLFHRPAKYLKPHSERNCPPLHSLGMVNALFAARTVLSVS